MRIALVAAWVLLTAGCGNFREEIAELNRLDAQMASEFHRPIGINLSNLGLMTLSVMASPDLDGKLDDDGRRDLALRMAHFARAKYARGDSLDRISVVWAWRTQYGPAYVSRSELVGSWPIADLTPDSTSGAP